MVTLHEAPLQYDLNDKSHTWEKFQQHFSTDMKLDSSTSENIKVISQDERKRTIKKGFWNRNNTTVEPPLTDQHLQKVDTSRKQTPSHGPSHIQMLHF